MMKANFNYDKIISSRENISVNRFNLIMGKKPLFQESSLTLSKGNVYGLIGKNGCGKTTLLNHITNKFNIDDSVLILLVKQEIEETDKSPVQVVLEANRDIYEIQKKLKKELDIEEYNKLQDQLNCYELDKQEPLVRKILNGLGFTEEEMEKPCTSFSGGWRMRISLARALYIKPDILLLDEPTNHLDLEATIWLSNYLDDWKTIALIVSHNVGFLNNVCTQIINIENYKLINYKGNYGVFKKNFQIKQKKLVKDYDKFLKKVKDFKKIKKKQPKKTKREIEDFMKKHHVDRPEKDYRIDLRFSDQIQKYNTTILRVENLNFSYPNLPIFDDVSFVLDMDSRITLVGKNGAGKSTLIKLLMGKEKGRGEIWKKNGIRFGYYHQHFEHLLEGNKTPIEYLLEFGEKEFEIRKLLGRIKLEGSAHKQKISTLSGGQKARVALVKLILQRPHFIFLDEPTNHLDIETIDALINGLLEYQGGVMVITHDSELITRLDSKLWILRDRKIDFYKNDFDDYVDEVLEES